MNTMIRSGSTCLILLALAPSLCADASTKAESGETPKQLSSPPLDHVEYPDDRPEWVESTLDIDKDSSRIVVVSGPCDTPEKSLEQLKLYQQAAVSIYASQLVGADEQTEFFSMSDEEIDHELVIRRYSGTVVHEGMAKYEHAVELGFTDEKQREILRSWNNLEVGDRLGSLGGLVFLGLTALICSSVVTGAVSRRVDRRDRRQAPA